MSCLASTSDNQLSGWVRWVGKCPSMSCLDSTSDNQLTHWVGKCPWMSCFDSGSAWGFLKLDIRSPTNFYRRSVLNSETPPEMFLYRLNPAGRHTVPLWKRVFTSDFFFGEIFRKFWKSKKKSGEGGSSEKIENFQIFRNFSKFKNVRSTQQMSALGWKMSVNVMSRLYKW